MDIRTGVTITIIMMMTDKVEPQTKYLVMAMASYRRNQSLTTEEQTPTGECTWKRVDCPFCDPTGLDR
jgi:hypothetical protein